jgi:hypothetical protein
MATVISGSSATGYGTASLPHSVSEEEQKVISKHIATTGKLLYVTTGNLYVLATDTDGWIDTGMHRHHIVPSLSILLSL